MNERASISLTALLSLVVGVLILFQLGMVVYKYVDDPAEDKAEQLPEISNFVLSSLALEEGKSVTRSLRADKEDLFLFFSKGTQPIELHYEGTADYASFSFERPEECNDASCTCYCREGPYWKANEEAPYVSSTNLRAAKEYSCASMTCQIQQEDIEFANSRGDTKYLAQIQSSKVLGYKPITMDVLTIINYADEIKKKSPTARNVNPFFLDEPHLYDYDTQDLNYVKVLMNYQWSGGYVLGGYGISLSEKDKKSKILSTPPVTLRLEHHGDGIVGICLQETCLFEEKIEKIRIERAERKLRESMMQSYTEFLSKVERVGTCQGGITNAIQTCDPTPLIRKIFEIEDIAKLDPQLRFTFQPGTENNKELKTIITFQDNTDNDNSLYPSLSTPFYFLCEDEENVQRIRDMTITAYVDDRFTVDESSCDIIFFIDPPAPVTT